MDVLNQVFNAVLRLYSAALAWTPSGVRLALISVVAGGFMIWAFGKLSNQERLRAVKRRVQAHLLEMRIFNNEPAVTWRAQKSLMRANLGYMGLMMKPVLYMALPMTFLLVHMEGFYGRAPLEVGREAIVTVALHGPATTAPELIAPKGIVVETPPVRVLDKNEVSWRIRPAQAVAGELRFVIDGRTISKRIEAGGAPSFVPGRRVASIYEELWHPSEPRIEYSRIDWIDVSYPDASVSLFGLSMNWLAWFFILSMLSALLLKKRFRVSL